MSKHMAGSSLSQLDNQRLTIWLVTWVCYFEQTHTTNQLAWLLETCII